jgi:hypothetical protein
MLIHKTGKICIYMHHQIMSKFKKLSNLYIYPDEHTVWLQETNIHLH